MLVRPGKSRFVRAPGRTRSKLTGMARVPARLSRVRTIPWLESVTVFTAESSVGSQKLGQPEPESYLVSDEKRGVPHPRQR